MHALVVILYGYKRNMGSSVNRYSTHRTFKNIFWTIRNFHWLSFGRAIVLAFAKWQRMRSFSTKLLIGLSDPWVRGSLTTQPTILTSCFKSLDHSFWPLINLRPRLMLGIVNFRSKFKRLNMYPFLRGSTPMKCIGNLSDELVITTRHSQIVFYWLNLSSRTCMN